MPTHISGLGRHPHTEEIKPRIRRRLTIVIATVLVAVYSIASTFVILNALQARRTEIEKLTTASNNLSQALDREIARAHALLLGLESSPALHADNLREFHKQLTETTVPQGAWLILSNKEKLLANSLFPFDTPMPSLSEFTPQPDFFSRIDQLEFSLTGWVRGVLTGSTAVTVNMKVPEPGGGWRYFLTTVLSDQRFALIIKQQRNPPNVTAAIFDHNRKGILSVKGEDVVIGPQIAADVSARLSAQPAAIELNGLVYADATEGPSLIAFNHSEYTQWTVATSMSRADLDGPLFDTLTFLAGTAFVLAMVGGGALLYLRRTIETPIDLLEHSVAEADETVEKLTGRLLQTQEDEQQRIASELHDSTAQHLVAALLGVMGMKKAASDKATTQVMNDIKSSIEMALNELRTFSYLLYPRDLATSGLASTLAGFVRGFLERSGLGGEVSIDPAADDLPLELQRTFLRIGQECLANVHRHAKATRIVVAFQVEPERASLTIQDNGQGNQFQHSDKEFGVGIASMRGRLMPYGGQLHIDNTTDGTTVRAIVPLPKVRS